MQNGITGTIYRAADWVSKLAYVNLLWIIFTLSGFVVFGFFPATVAMFAVCRKWIISKEDVPVFNTFLHTYKSEFLKINIMGALYTAGAYILWVDYQILKEITQMQSIDFFFLFVFLFYGIVFLYTFPIYVQYELKIREAVKNATFLAVSNPMLTCTIISGSLLIYYVSVSILGVFIFFSGSSLALLIMWASHRTFQKLSIQQS